jgi:class 3 adenylate cyclase
MALACPTCGAPVAEGARFCASCGAQLGEAVGRGEQRKVVSILFGDVTGSTSLGEQLDPERLRALLASYFAEMTQVIQSWGGTVEKYIGDAIMAVFGVPTVREDDAERALRAALEMGERLDALNEGFERDHRVRLQIRIGVNTGEVVAPVGSAREQLIVTGDAVNVAARLEQSATPGTILVGERTYLASRSAFTFEDPVDLDLKGKAAAVTARRLLGPLAEPQRGVPGLRAPMIEAAVAALEATTFDADAEALARVVAELADVRAVGPHMAALFDRADGRARLLRGDPDGAALLHSAVERFDAQAATFDAARTRELLAEAVSPEEARTLLESALATYRSLRATPHVARVEERLATL